jgi:Na+/H+ antiporter NhaC
VVTLAMYGVRFASVDPPSEDGALHDVARRSLAAGLRRIAAEQGIALKLDGEQMATPQGRSRGVTFLATLERSRLTLEYTLPDGTHGQVERDDFAPARRSSLLPFLLSTALVLLWRRPVLALFAGACCATFLMRRAADSGVGFAMLAALPDVFTRMVGPQLGNHSRMEFLATIAASIALVSVMTKSGGTRGLVDALGSIARGRRGTFVMTWVLGLATFADDTASRLLVGASMRPISDRFRASREKLAYLVDSTAVAVAGLALLTIWGTHEVAALAPALPGAKASAQQVGAVMVEMLPWRFYCVFTLFFALVLALSGRDFGAMLGAEKRAR